MHSSWNGLPLYFHSFHSIHLVLPFPQVSTQLPSLPQSSVQPYQESTAPLKSYGASFLGITQTQPSVVHLLGIGVTGQHKLFIHWIFRQFVAIIFPAKMYSYGNGGVSSTSIILRPGRVTDTEWLLNIFLSNKRIWKGMLRLWKIRSTWLKTKGGSCESNLLSTKTNPSLVGQCGRGGVVLSATCYMLLPLSPGPSITMLPNNPSRTLLKSLGFRVYQVN